MFLIFLNYFFTFWNQIILLHYFCITSLLLFIIFIFLFSYHHLSRRCIWLWQLIGACIYCKSNATWACNPGGAVSDHPSLHQPGGPAGCGVGDGGWPPEIVGRAGAGGGGGLGCSSETPRWKGLLSFTFWTLAEYRLDMAGLWPRINWQLLHCTKRNWLSETLNSTLKIEGSATQQIVECLSAPRASQYICKLVRTATASKDTDSVLEIFFENWRIWICFFVVSFVNDTMLLNEQAKAIWHFYVVLSLQVPYPAKKQLETQPHH